MSGSVKMRVKPKRFVSVDGVRYGAGSIIEVEQGTQSEALELVGGAPASVAPAPAPSIMPQGGITDGNI